MDHRRVSRKDSDRQMETEEDRGDGSLRMVNEKIEAICVFVDGAVAPLSGGKFNYCQQGDHKNR